MGKIFGIKIGVLLCSLLFSINLFAHTIVVRPGENYPLKKAINQATSGDTLRIKPGVYKEKGLILKKALTLIGEDYPILDGENKYEILYIEQDSITIQGLLFQNSGSSGYNDVAALKIHKSKNITIEDCQFRDNFFGIHTMNSKYVLYKNNDLKNHATRESISANGIHCWKSDHLTIENNSVEGHRDGIYLEFVTQSLIENNQSKGNKRYGLHFMFSHDNLYNHNTFQSNGAGVAVMYSKRVKMIRNLFLENWGSASYGVLLKEIDDSEVLENEFRDNTTALFADGANRTKIIGNQFISNGWALRVNASSSDPEITHNNFIGNTFDLATNGNIKLKSLDGNYWDKYEGYDLNRDGIGDVPYRPISFYSVIIEKNPGALMLFRSFFIKLMDKAESIYPFLTPENVKDQLPSMRKIKNKASDTVSKY